MNPEVSSLDSVEAEPVQNGSLLSAVVPGVSASARTGLAIREATPADASAIAQIHVETWRSAYRGIVSIAHLDSLSVGQRTEVWERILSENQGTVFVAERTGAMVGWISFGRCRDERESHQAEIYALYIASSHQRTGVGATLLWMAERKIAAERTNVQSRILLWVLERNHSARRFYEDLGYARGVWEKQALIGGERFTELRYEKEISRLVSSAQ